MPLAIFDLDNTLLAGDSDYLWGVFLCEQGLVDREEYEQANERFYQDYLAGQLDIDAFLRFALTPLTRFPETDLEAWREHYLQEKIDPIITQSARDLIARHRAAGDTLLIITATNSFVTSPIAERLHIPHLIATEPEHDGKGYTGQVAGIPSFKEGKVTRLRNWLAEHDQDLRDSWFYSDSRNDLPLLEQVDNPVAVDPDDHLRQIAGERGWPIISLLDE